MDVTYVLSLSFSLYPSISIPNVATTECILSKICNGAQHKSIAGQTHFIFTMLIIMSIQSLQPVTLGLNVLLHSHNLPGLLTLNLLMSYIWNS
jgi:hypothetical protein